VYVSGTDVYVTGEVSTTGIGSIFYKATLWKNGVAQTLNNTQRSYAYSVYVSGSDVYVAGVIGPIDDRQNQKATLWKNGTPQTLNDRYSIAYSVYISGPDVYVAGGVRDDEYENSLCATLWKNGVIQYLSNSSFSGAARSVYVSGNNVYVADYDHARYWENGTRKFLSITSNVTDGRVNSIFVVPNN
jgi:hypothetical protein